jgi:hypothetical protein
MEHDSAKMAPQDVRLVSNEFPEKRPVFQSNLQVWEPPVRGGMYIIGSDAGYGSSKGDFSVSVVFDRTDGTVLKEVALLRCRADPVEFADLTTLLAEWYNGAFVAPEAYGPGTTFCVSLVMRNRYPRVYQRETIDAVKDSPDRSEVFKIGFHTNVNNKGAAIQTTRSALQGGALVVRSKNVIDEMRRFVQTRLPQGTYKYEAPKGYHDDCVMAVAIAYFVHWKGAAPPVTPKKIQERAQISSRDPTEAAIWEDLRRERKAIHASMRRKMGPGWEPPKRL